MRGVCEEGFEELVYHQEASIRYERVEASNSCFRTLSSVPSLLLSFCQKKFLHLFLLFRFTFLLPFIFPFLFVLLLSLFYWLM
jgi:hypothetical protein